MDVLNHGDYWTNNILFRCDNEGNICQTKLIDFQLVVYGTYVIDLHYFTWSSISPCVRKQRLDELYSIYLETWNNSLERYGCEERISVEDFKIEMEATLLYGFFIVFCPLNILYSELEKDSISNGVEKSLHSPFAQPSYRKTCEEILECLEQREIFKNILENYC
uniref:CHK kinase-like domain-containing protein n=1 Tax=Clastoptera arizonana TaxID=38151 RepID=A0A1B6BY66_9HEMI